MILQEAREAWANLAGFRKNRDRCRNYTFGRQWSDPVSTDSGIMSEYEYIVREGNVPLKNNLIRRIVRNVLGVFRKQLPDLMLPYFSEIPEVAETNSLEELFTRTMEEYIISGMAVHRKSFGLSDGRRGVRTDIVSPSTFFFTPSAHDLRGRDIDIIGQFHDVDFRQWCLEMVKTRADYNAARRLFKDEHRKLRVTEIWRKEVKFSGSSPIMVWRYYFYADDGRLLCRGDSPYLHGSHPYVVRCYPFLDGEIQSLVADMIDQQRYANRLITLYDWVVRSSAKGVLLLPEGAVPTSQLQAVADQWGKFNGVIVYRAQDGVPAPQQVSSNSANMGISQLLEIQLKMLEDVSGVNGALQGNLAASSVSGKLYSQQTENSLNSLSDLLHSFGCFIADSFDKDLSLHRQMSAK